MASDQRKPNADLLQTVRRFIDKKAAGFREAWQTGAPPSLEDHIKTAREKLRPHVFRALLHIDCEYRRRQGETVAGEDYVQRFPEFRDVIEAVLPSNESAQTISDDTSAIQDQRPSVTQTETLMGGSTPATMKPRRTAAGSIGPYEIVRELGRGGMGVVYLAREENLDRMVALKLLRSDGFDSADERTRFRNEANTLAKVRHPNIVQIYRIGEHENRLYIVLEYIDGPNLAVCLAGNPQPPKEAAAFMEQVAAAIHAMHEQGVVHRDLKPANILLQIAEVRMQNAELKNDKNSAFCNLTSAIPKITDFGLAKGADDDHALTRTGDLLGTPSYMAPEQASGLHGEMSPAVDVYALGAILYEMLTGRPPFKADTLLATLEQVRYQEPVPPSRLQGKLPRDLETICLKCLQKDPRKRYATAKDLADDLHRFQAGKPIQARPVGVVERTWRWCRRNPLTSALTAAVVLALVAGTAVASYFAVEASQRAKEAERNLLSAKRAMNQTKKANAAEKVSRDRVEWTLYAHQICWAQRELQNNKTAKAGMILDTCRAELRNWEYRFLKGWSPGSGRTIYAGKLPVVDAAFSSDGKRIAYAVADGSVRVNDLASGSLVCEVEKHGQLIAGLAFVHDDKQLATVDVQGVVRIWSASDGQPVADMQAAVGKIRSIAVRPTTSMLAVGGDDGKIQIWDIDAKKTLRSWQAHQGPIDALAYHPSKNWLASGGGDHLINLWNADDGKSIGTLKGHRGPVYALAFDRLGQRIASGGTANLKNTDGRIILWDIEDRKNLFSVPNPLGAVRSVAFGADDDRLVTGTSDGSVKFWEVRHGQELLCLSEHAKAVTRVAFSPDGRYVLSASHDNTLKIWDSSPKSK